MFEMIWILIKNVQFECYNISVIDCSVKGIQCLLLGHKISNFSVIVFKCYPAPVTSPYGENETELFSHVISQPCLNSDVDMVYFCGDYNARTRWCYKRHWF